MNVRTKAEQFYRFCNIYRYFVSPESIDFSAAGIDTLSPIQIPPVPPGTLLAGHSPPFALQEERLSQPAASVAVEHF